MSNSVSSRHSMSSMEDDEDICMFPITDLDNNNFHDGLDHEADDEKDSNGSNEEDEEDYFKPAMTLRQRRNSMLGFGPPLRVLPKLNLNVHPQIKERKPLVCETGRPRAKRNWLNALRLIKKQGDPWAQYHITDLPEEKAIRHRYNALKKKWMSDEVTVKMEFKPFNKGAMRICYRMKKLSKFIKNGGWNNAQNYVAKKYMENVTREVYFEDVRLQMDAKLWGEEYSRHRPPKQVDIFQMYIIEFKDRPDAPLYHLEHFIEGEYIKYNSNSGFVEEQTRMTPQAFSHFTFERSGHQLIVVDIQGVGDLWTDPQIHTGDGKGYGDGNLGTKGMALFFHSHICNSICKSLHLGPFDLAPSERQEQENFIRTHQDSTTKLKADMFMCVSPSPVEKVDLTLFLAHSRERAISRSSNGSIHSIGSPPPDGFHGDRQSSIDNTSNMDVDSEPNTPGLPGMRSPPPNARRQVAFRTLSEASETTSETTSLEDSVAQFLSSGRVRFTSGGGDSESDESPSPEYGSPPNRMISRIRNMSECDDYGSESVIDDFPCNNLFGNRHGSEEAIKRKFEMEYGKHRRSSCVVREINFRNLGNHPNRGFRGIITQDSLLGEIHHDMAKYHEMGRFAIDNEEPNMKAATYHEEMAASLGVLEAILTMAHLYLGMQRDVLVDCIVESNEDHINKGVGYMLLAAEAGDRAAMIFMAQAYESGNNIGSARTMDWEKAMYWYEEAINHTEEDEGGNFDAMIENPIFELQAKMAQLYASGGHSLEKDPQKAGDLYNEAADGAMASMKGRMANKYYALAEELWGEVEE